MKIVRNFLAIVCFSFIANFASASEAPISKKPEGTQIQTYLKTIDFNEFIDVETKVNISFFVNAQNEMIVVSTNNKQLDSVLKSALNYKKINLTELDYQKIYTVPVVIK
jgi:hypothetical protein